MQVLASKSFMLGNRHFTPVEYDSITSECECYVMTRMRKSGLDRVMPMEDEPDVAFLARLQSALVDSELLHELLAGYLLPDGTTEADWTPELAATTTKWLKQLRTREDRAKIHEMAVALCMSFFAEGISSLRHFQNALTPMDASQLVPPLPSTRIAEH